MRKVAVWFGLACGVTWVGLAACAPFDYISSETDADDNGSSSGQASEQGSSSGEPGAGVPEVPVEPVPGCEQAGSALELDLAHGLFVRAGAAAGGDGGLTRPFSRINDALVALHAKRAQNDPNVYKIYIAAGAYEEALQLDREVVGAGVELHGGLDGTFAAPQANAVSAVLAPNDGAPSAALTVLENAGAVRLERLALIGPSRTAAAAHEQPDSYGAALVRPAAEISLRCVSLTGRQAAKGQDGAAGDKGENGADGRARIGDSGKGGQKSCLRADDDAEVDVSGGDAGGDRAQGQRGKGEEGVTGAVGAGGGGDSLTCNDGGSGEPGNDGREGEPVARMRMAEPEGFGLRALHAAETFGGRGQPGGGGGGSGNGVAWSGGGGGSGGCGGQGGAPGQLGGVSAGLLLQQVSAEQVQLHKVRLQGGDAGQGGAGGVGGAGGKGGKGGTTAAACLGGKGGQGGQGGQGGAGMGGSALCLLLLNEGADASSAAIALQASEVQCTSVGAAGAAGERAAEGSAGEDEPTAEQSVGAGQSLEFATLRDGVLVPLALTGGQ